MSVTDGDLVRVCEQTATAVREAVDWLEANRDVVGAKHLGLRREFRQREMLAKRYMRAAQRPMCVGVFGPSQTGKSYLVAALARKTSGPLWVVLDREREFLQEINPELEQEATGLVTRFTIRQSGAPKEFPVVVRLLSQTDIVKILANTFFLDFDPAKEQPPRVEDVAKALDAARAALRPASVDNLQEVEIDDLRRYFEEQFKARRTYDVLQTAGYWSQLEEMAPRLKLEDRLKLYAYLWGGLPEFSTLFGKIYGALEALGFAEEVFCPIEALIPREQSIISVNTLKGLAETRAETIEVIGAGNRPARISRPLLTAIVAELLFQIKEQPWPYFDKTDLLDFPGARSRMLNEDAATHVKKPGAIEELFRRGKVAYLFDRYCAEQELTGMLLCLTPGNQEVRTLPGLVMTWLHATHGASAKYRVGKETSLYLVLTKFDRRFEEAKGKAETSDDRWTAAIETTLTKFFAVGQDNWPSEWTPGKPFNNSYWLRNPNFISPGLMRYDINHAEVGVLNDAMSIERMARFKSDYLNNSLIRRHFKDPQKAWDAAFSVNDGGITYLAESLAPVCRPEIKAQQIRGLVDQLRRDIRGKLSEFYVGDDRAAEAEKRLGEAKNALSGLRNVVLGQRFGHLISYMQLGSEDLQYLFRRQSADDGEDADVVAGRSLNWDEIISPIYQSDISSANGSAKLRQAGDWDSQLAATALEYWSDRLQSLPSQKRVLDFLHVEASAIDVLVRELIAGSERIGLSDALADDIRQAQTPIEEGDMAMARPAVISAERINRFVARLGQDEMSPADRATIVSPDGRKQPVFAKRDRIDALPTLPDRGEAFFQPYIRDWLAAFQFMVKENASGGEVGRKYNLEQNARLLSIMTKLSSPGLEAS